MRPDHGGVALVLVLVSAALGARARPTSLERDAHTLAVALVSEAGQRLNPDHLAVVHVLERRSQRRAEPLTATVRAYCQVYRRPASAFGLGVLQASPTELERRAPDVVELARAWARGELPDDPCPGATHFGQAHGRDLARARRAGWRRVVCLQRVVMAYWTER